MGINIVVRSHRDQRAACDPLENSCGCQGFRTIVDHSRRIKKLLRPHARHFRQHRSHCRAYANNQVSHQLTRHPKRQNTQIQIRQTGTAFSLPP